VIRLNKSIYSNYLYIYLDQSLIVYIKIFDERILIDFHLMYKELSSQKGYQLLLTLNTLKQIYHIKYKSNPFTLSYLYIDSISIFEVGELLTYKLLLKKLLKSCDNAFIVGYNSCYFYSKHPLSSFYRIRIIKQEVLEYLLTSYADCIKENKRSL